MAVYFVAGRNVPLPCSCRNARPEVLSCEHAKLPCELCGLRYPQLRKLESPRGMGFLTTSCWMTGCPPAATITFTPLRGKIGQRTRTSQGYSRPVVRGRAEGAGRHRPAARAW